MTGVFGAGVATSLEENDFYKHTSAIYGSSAGIMTGAYFLSRQTALGATIYWEDLPDNFIQKKDFLFGTWQRFQDKFIKNVAHESLRDALNIDYAMSIVRGKKRLNVDELLSQSIPLYIKLLDLDTHEICYLDARREDVLDILEMGISAFPYVHRLKKVDGRRYIDAGIADVIGINELLGRHPEDHIVVVLNRPPETRLYYRIKNRLEGKFMQWMFDDPDLYPLHALAEERLQEDIREITRNERVTLVAPPEGLGVKSRTDNPELLVEMYKAGKITGLETLSKISTLS